MEFNSFMNQAINMSEFQDFFPETLGSINDNNSSHNRQQQAAADIPQFMVISDMQSLYGSGFPSTSSTSSSSSQNEATPTLEFQAYEQMQQQPPPEIQLYNADDSSVSLSYHNRPSTASKKFRGPIFVTELPQNSYKKKGGRGSLVSLSLTSFGEDDDDDEGATEEEIARMKKMSSKERRQLRNKISARNFRVRRKEYIEHLESRVSRQDKELALLRDTNKRLEKVNLDLTQELEQWRQLVVQQQHQQQEQQQQQPSPESNTDSIPDLFPLLDMNEFTLFDFTTNLSHAAIPHFDFGRVLNEKHSQPLTPPSEMMRSFPLLAPALMSIIISHTMTYVNEQEFMSTISQTPVYDKSTFPKPTELLVASNNEEKKDQIDLERAHVVEYQQPNVDEWLLKKHYLWYTWMRVRGYSHEQLVASARACAERGNESFSDRIQRKINTVAAFCSVGTTLLKHPERTALMPAIVKNHARLDWSSNFDLKHAIENDPRSVTRMITSQN